MAPNIQIIYYRLPAYIFLAASKNDAVFHYNEHLKISKYYQIVIKNISNKLSYQIVIVL